MTTPALIFSPSFMSLVIFPSRRAKEKHFIPPLYTDALTARRVVHILVPNFFNVFMHDWITNSHAFTPTLWLLFALNSVFCNKKLRLFSL